MVEVEEWHCLLSLDGMAPGQAPLPSTFPVSELILKSICFRKMGEVEEWQCLLSLDGMAPGQAPLPSTFRLRFSPDGGVVG